MTSGLVLSLLGLCSSLCLIQSRNLIPVERRVVATGTNFSFDCPTSYDTKSVWWIKDEMTVVSVNGEEPSFSAAVLWPESHNKYHFEIQGYNYRMTVFNASLKDASNYRCVVNVYRSGLIHDVAVFGNLSCNWIHSEDDKAEENRYSRYNQIPAKGTTASNSFHSQSTVSKSENHPTREMRCSVETSDNFNVEDNLTFRLFAVGETQKDNSSDSGMDGKSLPSPLTRDTLMKDVSGDKGLLVTRRTSRSRLKRRIKRKSYKKSRPDRFPGALLTQPGRRLSSNRRVFEVVFRWHSADGDSSRRWRIRVDAADSKSHQAGHLDLIIEEPPKVVKIIEGIQSRSNNTTMPSLSSSGLRNTSSKSPSTHVTDGSGTSKYSSSEATTQNGGEDSNSELHAEDDDGVINSTVLKENVDKANEARQDLIVSNATLMGRLQGVGIVIIILVVVALIVMSVYFFHPRRGMLKKKSQVSPQRGRQSDAKYAPSSPRLDEANFTRSAKRSLNEVAELAMKTPENSPALTKSTSKKRKEEAKIETSSCKMKMAKSVDTLSTSTTSIRTPSKRKSVVKKNSQCDRKMDSSKSAEIITSLALSKTTTTLTTTTLTKKPSKKKMTSKVDSQPNLWLDSSPDIWM